MTDDLRMLLDILAETRKRLKEEIEGEARALTLWHKAQDEVDELKAQLAEANAARDPFLPAPEVTK